MACAEIAKAVVEELDIPVVSGMYIENPGLDVCKSIALVAETSDSAAGMRKALPVMANLAKKIVKGGEELGSLEKKGIYHKVKDLQYLQIKEAQKELLICY